MKVGMYIMPPEPISTAYFIIKPSISLCVCICILIVARQRLGKNFTASTNTLSNGRIVVRVIFYAVRVVEEENIL
jgi:hypothetical protein